MIQFTYLVKFFTENGWGQKTPCTFGGHTSMDKSFDTPEEAYQYGEDNLSGDIREYDILVKKK